MGAYKYYRESITKACSGLGDCCSYGFQRHYSKRTYIRGNDYQVFGKRLMGQNKIKRQSEMLSSEAGVFLLDSIKADLQAKNDIKNRKWFCFLIGSGIVRPIRNERELNSVRV